MSKRISLLPYSGGNMWIKRSNTYINLYLVQEIILDNDQILIFFEEGKLWRSLAFPNKEEAEKMYESLNRFIRSHQDVIDLEGSSAILPPE